MVCNFRSLHVTMYTLQVPSKPLAYNTKKAYQLILEKCAHVTDGLECDCSEEVMMRRSCLRFEALLNQLEVSL